jgi:uncharacterized delta-60 repeat protein
VDAGVDAGAPRDLDVVVVRLNADGTLDTSFGAEGVARVDFGAATGAARDTVYGFDRDSAGRLVLFGSTKAAGRTDVDRFVARLTATGQLDSTFATDGVFRLDVAGTSDSARHGFVQADGKIVAAGYSSIPTGVPLADGGVQSANEIVLLRLTADGKADATFGDGGVVATPHFVPSSPATTPWGMAESYAVVPQSGGRYVTAGYGRVAASGTVDMVSFRYDNAGADDATWGNAGAVVFDLIGGDERGRHAVSLADDRVVIVGSGVPLSVGNVDPLVMVLGANGALDATFDGDGVKTWSFGRNDEAWLGAAVSPGGLVLAAAGHRAGPANTESENDDATLLLLPLSVGAPAEFAQPVPLSTTGHDRFLGVTWDGSKVVAAGFVREGGDTKFAVARFSADGARDTTFGVGGVVTVNVAQGAGVEELARWVVVQPDGKIVVAGTAEH